MSYTVFRIAITMAIWTSRSGCMQKVSLEMESA